MSGLGNGAVLLCGFSSLDAYKEHGVEKFKFVATMDAGTCAVCGGLDGQVFLVEDFEVGVNAPPMHPNDRCTTAPYFGELKGQGGDGMMGGEKVPAEKTSGLFTVDPSMQAKDIEMGVLDDGVYIKNPTAQNISDLVKPGSNYVGSNKMNGQYMFVVDSDRNIIIGTRAGQYMPHPTLIGGQNPIVQGAGIVELRGGKIYSVNNASGHFKPSESSLAIVQNTFEQLISNVFHKNFQGYITYTG